MSTQEDLKRKEPTFFTELDHETLIETLRIALENDALGMTPGVSKTLSEVQENSSEREKAKE